jgi:hypothetical protein
MKTRKLYFFMLIPLCILLTLACSLGGLSGTEEDAQPIQASIPTEAPDNPPLPSASPPTTAPQPSAVVPQSVPSAGLTGRYTYERLLPDGTIQNGSLRISEFGEGYEFEWNNSAGVALMSGNSVAVAAGDKCGVVLYEIKRNNTMDGIWMDGGGIQGTEELEPNASGSSENISGSYVIDGYNPDSSRYGGTAGLTPLGSIYSMHWETGGGASNYYGIAIPQGKQLAVSYGGDHCTVYFVQIQPDGSLNSIIGFNDGRVGRETAVRK